MLNFLFVNGVVILGIRNWCNGDFCLFFVLIFGFLNFWLFFVLFNLLWWVCGNGEGFWYVLNCEVLVDLGGEVLVCFVYCFDFCGLVLFVEENMF